MTREEFKKFIDSKSIEDIYSFSSKYDNGELSFESVQSEISFLYDLGLFYSEFYETANPVDTVFRVEDKYYLAIYYYLKAINLYEENKHLLLSDTDFVYRIMRRLYVNIGNEFSNQFRSVEALSYYRKAIEIDKSYDMALGNFAKGIEHHSPLIGTENDVVSKLFNYLYRIYNSIRIENLESGDEYFVRKKLQYSTKQEKYNTHTLLGIMNYNPFDNFTEIKNQTDNYDDWCVKNVLYLNLINDIGDFEEAKFDIDVFAMISELNVDKPRLHVLFYLFYLFQIQRQKIFKCRSSQKLTEAFELAQVFQCLYSYFDKVAFFIYKFFNLVGTERAVSIKSIWTMKDSEKNTLLQYRNQYLYDIYWLRKEYREYGNDTLKINELLSPDAQGYADIRNTLEHKEFSFELIDGLMYVNPKHLYSKTLKLAKVVRNMLLSLIRMIIAENKLTDPKTHKRNFDLIYLEYEGFNN